MTNALPARKDSQVRETVLSPVAPQGFPGQTNLIDFGFDGFPDPLRASPGLELLKSATFFIDAAYAKTGDAYAFNKGTGGFALDARYGSSLAIGASDTNDPLLLPWSGTNYLYLPGVAGNYASTPDSAALDITGDIDLIAFVAMDDWSPAASNVLISKLNGAGTSSYELRVATGGNVQLRWSVDGTTVLTRSSTVIMTTADGAPTYVRVTLDVDNLSSGHDVTFYTSADGVTWTQLGAVVTTAGVTSVFASAANLFVGSQSDTGSPLAGKFYRAIVRNGIGGTTVFDANFTTGITSGGQTTFTESSSNAATVTINRSTAGRKAVAVTRPVWLFGTDDYMEVLDNALLNMDASQSFTVLAVVRQWATPANFGRYVSKSSSNGWQMLANGTALRGYMTITDGTTSSTPLPAGLMTSGTLTALSGVVNVSDATVKTYTTNVVTSVANATLGTLANTSVMRIGADGGAGGSYQDIELLAVAVFRRALTATEIAQINTYYGTA